MKRTCKDAGSWQIEDRTWDFPERYDFVQVGNPTISLPSNNIQVASGIVGSAEATCGGLSVFPDV